MTKKSLDKLRVENNLSSKKFDIELLKVKLKEVQEEMVDLHDFFNKSNVKIDLVEKVALLRESVAMSLLESAKYFNNKGLVMRIESSYRSISEQQKRFKDRFKLVKKQYPNMTKKELLVIANTYTAGIPILAAHTAGAAVDVVLLDKFGVLLDFGIPYPHGDVESSTDFPYLSKKVKDNRNLLKKGMESSGFINYPFEYWHYSKGDVCAAYLTGQKYAIYGPADYNSKTKKTAYLNDIQRLYQFFEVMI